MISYKPQPSQDWRVDLKVVGASVVTTSGGLAIVGGLGCVAAGTALTASGVLAPVGVPLITTL